MNGLPRFSSLEAQVPRRGNFITKFIARSILSSLGWSLRGNLSNQPKAVLIVAPHSSNWDFVLGITVMFALGARFSWLGKAGIFRKPFGRIMRWLGGVPVDRNAPAGVVKQILHEFDTSKTMLLGLAPEGTRSKVSEWRTGFWRIARRAQVPIIPVFLDYGRRIVGFTEAFYPGEDIESDIAALKLRYRDIKARKMSPQEPRS